MNKNHFKRNNCKDILCRFFYIIFSDTFYCNVKIDKNFYFKIQKTKKLDKENN